MMTQREFFVLKLVRMVKPDIRIYHECQSGIENSHIPMPTRSSGSCVGLLSTKTDSNPYPCETSVTNVR